MQLVTEPIRVSKGHLWLSGVGKSIECKQNVIQILLWSLDFVISKKSEAQHHAKLSIYFNEDESICIVFA